MHSQNCGEEVLEAVCVHRDGDAKVDRRPFPTTASKSNNHLTGSEKARRVKTTTRTTTRTTTVVTSGGETTPLSNHTNKTVAKAVAKKPQDRSRNHMEPIREAVCASIQPAAEEDIELGFDRYQNCMSNSKEGKENGLSSYEKGPGVDHDEEDAVTAASNDIVTVFSNDVASYVAAVTNDPNSKKHDKNEEKDDSPDYNDVDDPEANYGCIKGLKRDRHLKHFVLYLSTLIFVLALIGITIKDAGKDCDSYRTDCHMFSEMPGLAAFLFLLVYAIYLSEAFCCSSTFQYLRKVNSTESVIEYMKRMYGTEPRLIMSMECYHYETRVVYHTDSNGNSYTTTRQVVVVTWTGSIDVDIVSWKDDSVPLRDEEVRKYQVTKVKLSKTFAADEGYERQKFEFIAANRFRDGTLNLTVCCRKVHFCCAGVLIHLCLCFSSVL